jgi:hypothetical protein
MALTAFARQLKRRRRSIKERISAYIFRVFSGEERGEGARGGARILEDRKIKRKKELKKSIEENAMKNYQSKREEI